MPKDNHCTAWESLGALILLGAGLGAWICGAAQRPTKDFKITDYYDSKPGRTNQLRSLLSGSQAILNLNGTVAITNGFQLRLYREDGITNLVAQAPSCLVDPRSKSASSAGPLQVSSGDGRLTITGEGFQWQQTNASLMISNRVRTRIQDEQPVDVVSDQFVYSSALTQVQHRGHVQIQESQMEMTCGLLTLKLPEPGGALKNIVAETNVIVLSKADGSQARGERAEYRAEPGRETVELTGAPSWQQGLRQCTADRLELDRQSRTFRAVGHAYMKLPRTDMAQPGFLLPGLAPATNAPADTNRFLEVFAEEYAVRTNLAVFSGQVRAIDYPSNQPPAEVRCERMILRSESPEGKMDHLELQTHVVIEQGSSRIQAEQVIYRQRTGLADFMGHPTWQQDDRSGSADALQLHLNRRALVAHGHARMTFPANAMSESLWSVGLPVTNAPPSLAGERRLEILADEADAQAGFAVFHGHVLVRDLLKQQLRGTLACEQLTVTFDESARRIEILVAERQVVVERYPDLPDPTSAPTQTLRCERMTAHTPKGQLATLIADQSVSIRLVDRQGVRTARGAQMTYLASANTAELIGEAEVRLPEGVVRAPALLWNLTLQTVGTRGRTTANFTTHLASIPKLPAKLKP